MLNLLVNISDKVRYAKYIQVQKELIYKKAVNFQHYSFWVVSKTLENLSEFLFFFFSRNEMWTFEKFDSLSSI